MPNVEETTPAKSDPLERARAESEEAVYDWLSGLGSQGDMDVTLKRTFPPEFQGVMTKGVLGHYDQPITEEQIKSSHGGGRFQVVVKTRRPDGRWKYAGSRTFEIAGTPKISALLHGAQTNDDDVAATPINGGPDSMGQQAMNVMMNLTRNAQERADAASRNGGTDWEAIERLIAPMRDELGTMRQVLADKDKQILDLLNKPADTSSQDRLFGIMETKESSYSNSLNAIRTQHDSELRSIREFNREEIKRRESRFEKEIEHVRAAAQREIDSLKIAHTQALDSQRHGFEMRIDGLKDIQQRLERDLQAKETELVALRARKDQGPLDQIQNLVTLKNGFDALVPQSDAPTSAWAKAAEIAGPLVEGIAARMMGPPGADPDAMAAQQQAMLNAPEGGQEEMVTVRRADGKLVQMPRSYYEQLQAQHQAAGAGEQQAQVQPEPNFELSKEDVARAVTFIEAAIRNGTDPETFARSARNMIPDNILSYVKQRGVDAFLNDVAKLETSSPLATVAGRTYVRKVAKFLLEGTTEGVEEEVAAPQPTPVESP